MASKGRKDAVTLRKISKPVISTDVMGNRNVEVRAVGAWVEAEPALREPEAVISAQEEEIRLRQVQLEKQARLKHFQAEVRKRVNKLDKLKKQSQLETNYRAAEHERNVVGQSAFSSQDSAKKDTSLVRPHTALGIIKAAKHQKDSENPHSSLDLQAFCDQTNQVHRHVSHAKKNLVSRRVITENFVADDLPGGVWKISKTRDHPSSRYTVDGEEFDILDDQLIEKVKVVNNKEYNFDDNVEAVDEHLRDSSDKENDVVHEELPVPSTKKFVRKVQFDDQPREYSRRPQTVTSFTGTDLNRNLPLLRVPNIYEGVETEEEKRRARAQQAMYRRLFMDIEREQVKENLRRQEHRKRIIKLKKEKEEERVREEQISEQLVEPRDPVTGETSTEALEREEQDKQFIRRTIREHERRAQKSKEMERYIGALREQLKDKVRRRGVELPPLCCCGDSIWDTNPETCANNCVFYKNPKEYGRALQAMLDSSDFLTS
ncbi:coiled-coil domain-containing protein 15-like isoform X2 [Dreissena polymorpha]|uniref:coiled-coil domain-containing protein 15-like isoform X2 n=1 Tax=Dreissena polymorpha TaxID=45954 RepID=UPI00226493A1|nr:coiled-coil domain-containing protein 15-like isoform X2 [Dreissena polymorpha]